MYIVFDYIQKYPAKTKHILGISHEKFKKLIQSASTKHLEILKEKEKHKIRVHSPGGGRKELLSISEEICLCLFYLRQIPTVKVTVAKFQVYQYFHLKLLCFNCDFS